MRKILNFGCSHTAGAEIIKPWDGNSLDLAYGSVLSKMLGCNIEQTAGNGWSNQWIQKNAFNVCLEYLDKKSKPLIVIGWTSIERVPLQFAGQQTVYHSTVHLPPEPKYYPVPNYAKIHNAVYGSYVNKPDAHEMGVLNILTFQSWLKEHNFPFLFFWAVNSVSPLILEKYKNCFDPVRFYEPFDHANSYWMYYQEKFWDKSERWKKHAPAEFHKHWAEKLYFYICKHKLLDNDV